MAIDPGYGYAVTATVTGVKGKCQAGHQLGDRFPISCYDAGGLCGFCYHAIFPDLQTFQFGGKMPWFEGDTTEMICPDPVNLVTIRLERTERKPAE